MKNLSWAVLGLLLCVPFTGAETIDSVSFNPARLGRYETLKVSDQLTTKGGIEANAVTVQSGGTVSVNNAGNYKFPATEVKGSVEMTSTDFKADTLNSRGTASFENKSSSAESKISTLNTSTADVRANILDLTSVTVPTGGSLTLGENAIPEPTQSCSNLRWVERTTDDNYKYKVLAFGACAGGDDDCVPNYGSWVNTSETPKDTCDGDAEKEYQCPVPYDGEKFSCVDFIRSTVDVGGQGVKYGAETIIGRGDYSSAQGKDTCDGDIFKRYTGRKNCTDVFFSAEGSSLLMAESCDGLGPYGNNNIGFSAFTCVGGTYKEPPSDDVIKGWARYLDSHSVEDFCATQILEQNNNWAGTPAGCQQLMKLKNPINNCSYPRQNTYGQAVYEGFKCKGNFKSREVIFQGYDKILRRNITCCPNEVNMGTVTGGNLAGGVTAVGR